MGALVCLSGLTPSTSNESVPQLWSECCCMIYPPTPRFLAI
uniref:Uncharacterized protein n=1 Tax=Rhizophora mucronata TaxID=61149 RepID=A0A2P2IPA3_RHIMU